MKKTNIELFPVLNRLCGWPTPSSFASSCPEFWLLQAAVSKYEMEERTFYWLPDCDGGLCVMERDVFLRGTHDHQLWTSQRPEAGAEAYHIVVRGGDRKNPRGDIRSFDFSAHLHRLEHTAVEVKAVELVFYSGLRFSMEPEWLKVLYWKYGTLRRIRYLPENEAALVRTIMMEHRYQKGWTPRKGRAPPSGPVR